MFGPYLLLFHSYINTFLKISVGPIPGLQMLLFAPLEYVNSLDQVSQIFLL